MSTNRTKVIVEDFPTLVRVGAVDYYLDFSEEFSENLGETEPNVAHIKVSRGLPSGKFAVTLVHEICHALVEEFGILQDTPLVGEKAEEAIVTRFATAFATVLQNNQILFFKIIHTLDSGLMAKATAAANAESTAKPPKPGPVKLRPVPKKGETKDESTS